MAIVTFVNDKYPELVSGTSATRMGEFLGATITRADDTGIVLKNPSADTMSIRGVGLTYSPLGQLIGGTITTISTSHGFQNVRFENLNVQAAQAWDWLVRGAVDEAVRNMLSGNDSISGSGLRDVLNGYDGNDRIEGWQGSDSIFGGAGNDTIAANTILNPDNRTDSKFLRGEEGNDSILGSNGFDDIHGNQGADTANGGLGVDWVVGGQDNDLLYGGGQGDIVYGNLGNDTVYGDGVNYPGQTSQDWGDYVRGGQGEDSIIAGGGNDELWGDRGADTLVGGSGADIFHMFAGIGRDIVTDFSGAEGDKVVRDFGETYTIRQDGFDTVVDLGNGDQLVLVGVNLASLPQGWI